jgi:dipeptidyl aminopeptidase/acylaminoacyl peptidase
MPKGLTPHQIIYGIVTAGDPQVSPDGATLLFTRSWSDPGAAKSKSAIWKADGDGNGQRVFTMQASAPRWSPDGTRVAFVSDRGDYGNAVFVTPAAGGEAAELARHRGRIDGLAWSPDGTTLAYTSNFDPGDPDDSGPDENAAPRVRVVRRYDYKQDNRGFLNDVRQQVWLVGADGSGKRKLTSELVDFEFPQWSPDGATLAARILLRNNMAGQLGLIDVASGAVTRIGPEEGTLGAWAWSPDGSRIIFAGDTQQTWQYDLFLYDVESGTTDRLTVDLPVQPDSGFATVSPPSQPVWLNDELVLLHAFRGGSSGLYRFDIERAELEPVQDFGAVHGGLMLDRVSGAVYQTASSLDGGGRIVKSVHDPQSSTVVIDPNAELFAETSTAEWGKFTIRRGELDIDAWLLKPAGFDPSKRYPLVIDIHGGPNSWYGPGFSNFDQALAGAGFAVVYANPRGSGSYGRDFTQQVTNDWGGEDYLDLMAVVDKAIERPWIDEHRLGVYGYSYGGFMASWIIGHTDRFKAAVIGAPVVDLVSFYGTADIGYFFGPAQMGARPNENPEQYRFRSPITYLTRDRKTPPVLILHGEADDRVPISQGEQLFMTLQQNGAEVEFVRYPNGSHASVTRTGYPAHRKDYLERLVGWMEKWL